jgi:hypothetical protein
MLSGIHMLTDGTTMHHPESFAHSMATRRGNCEASIFQLCTTEEMESREFMICLRKFIVNECIVFAASLLATTEKNC